MTVLRVRKKVNNYLVLDKTCLKQTNLSWGAKGLHSYLLSLPSEWCVNVYDLTKRATNGRDSVRGLLNELGQAGYIVKEQRRDVRTGKFNALEYIIYELPQNRNNNEPEPSNPETGCQVAVLPETVFPAPEKPFLINNDINKYPENKIITAAASEPAAALFLQKKHSQPPSPRISFIHPAAPADAVIGTSLTPYQRERLDCLIQTVNQQGFCVSAEEVEHSLLSSTHFKGSGQDFGRKLNAIGTVIKRGEWQTPAELILSAQKKLDNPVVILKSQFYEAQAEVTHFQRLLDMANESMRGSIEEILTRARNKMKEIEGKIVAAAL